MQQQAQIQTRTDSKKPFLGILQHWFIHIDATNRFCVVGANLMTDELDTELTTPIFYIDTQHWLAETAAGIYLLSHKDTSLQNKQFHYERLAATGAVKIPLLNVLTR
jgi:hypothetical protein